ncbi:MAG TPA: hypothetical protein VIM00_07755 [Candidatus Acidoferrum sp.]
MAFIVSSISFVVLVSAWFALNHFRVGYYNSAVEGPSAATSPYWALIRVQGLLKWPVIFSIVFAVLMLLIEFAHCIATTISKRNIGKHDSVLSDDS